MDFSLHIRTIFATRGTPATYAPPSGGAVACRMIRQGGGQPVKIGPITVTIERISFHVRRSDVSSPVAGAIVTHRGETFTVEACQPVERDAEGLLWSLEVSWGASMLYRSVTGSGATQSPPQGSNFVVAANAIEGAAAISIKSSFAVGKLVAGDKITVGGNTYSVTGSGVQAVMNQFSAVPVTPALAANVAPGDAVVLFFARDIQVRGAVAAYAANEFMGGVLAGDRRVVIMQAALAGLDTTPKAGDKLIFEDRSFNVQSAVAIYQGASPIAWDIQVRG